MIIFNDIGDFSKTFNFLNNIKDDKIDNKIETILDKYGQKGVYELSLNTPKDSGKTASSWYYKIEKIGGKISISWYNSNVNEDVPIAIILQYGHGTKNGGYVEGRDYINPTMKPIFDEIANLAWEEVNKE